jgi:hypothetical protein
MAKRTTPLAFKEVECNLCERKLKCSWHAFKGRYLCATCWDLPTYNLTIAAKRARRKPLTARELENKASDFQRIVDARFEADKKKHMLLSHPDITDPMVVDDRKINDDPSPPKSRNTFAATKRGKKAPPPHPDAL